MGKFTSAITEGGHILLADMQAGAVFIPTKIVMGSGNMPAGKTPATMTDVVAPVIELTINKKERTADGKCIIGGVYSNKDISADYYWRELAIYARAEYRDETGNVLQRVEERLYSYGNAGTTADLMPAYASAVVERQLDLVTYVGNDTQVDLTIETGIYMTQEQGRELFALLDHKHTAADVGAVAKTGDTMKGNLKVAKASYPQFIAENSATGRLASLVAADSGQLFLYNQKDSNNRQILFLNKEDASLGAAIQLQRQTTEKGTEIFNVLHTGNKNLITAEDVGAVPVIGNRVTGFGFDSTNSLHVVIDGKVYQMPFGYHNEAALMRDGSNAMTGDLNIAKPTNNNRLALASEAGYSALRHLETLTSSNDYRQLMLYGNAATLKDCLRLYSVVGGKNDATHYIYHTGNKPTAEDVGAVKYEIYSGDMNSLVTDGHYRLSTNANLPGSAYYGLCDVVRGSAGMDTVAQIVFGIKTQSGGHCAIFRSGTLKSDVWTWEEWARFATTDTALMRDGSNAMTGNLTIESNTNKQIDVKNTTSGRTARMHINATNAQFHNVKDRDNYTAIVLGTEDDAHGNNLRLRVQKGGTPTFYPLYHTGYKPTAADVGAVALNGSNSMTGDLTIQKTGDPFIVMSNVQKGAFGRLRIASDASLGVENFNTSGKRVAMFLQPPDVANKVNAIGLIADFGTGEMTYPILHTGNVIASQTDITAGSSASWQQYLVYE